MQRLIHFSFLLRKCFAHPIMKRSGGGRAAGAGAGAGAGAVAGAGAGAGAGAAPAPRGRPLRTCAPARCVCSLRMRVFSPSAHLQSSCSSRRFSFLLPSSSAWQVTQSPGRTQRLRGGTRGAQRLRRASRGSKRRATENARTVYSGVFGPRLTPGVRHCRQEAWPRGPLSRAPCPHRLPGRHALPTGRSGDGSSPGAGEGAWLVCPPGRAAAQLAGAARRVSLPPPRARPRGCSTSRPRLPGTPPAPLRRCLGGPRGTRPVPAQRGPGTQMTAGVRDSIFQLLIFVLAPLSLKGPYRAPPCPLGVPGPPHPARPLVFPQGPSASSSKQPFPEQ